VEQPPLTSDPLAIAREWLQATDNPSADMPTVLVERVRWLVAELDRVTAERDRLAADSIVKLEMHSGYSRVRAIDVIMATLEHPEPLQAYSNVRAALAEHDMKMRELKS
jgi:hypothetical protein